MFLSLPVGSQGSFGSCALGVCGKPSDSKGRVLFLPAKQHQVPEKAGENSEDAQGKAGVLGSIGGRLKEIGFDVCVAGENGGMRDRIGT